MAWRCFLVEPTDRCRRWLRVYESHDCPGAPGQGFCNAQTLVADGPVLWTLDEAGRKDHYRTEEEDVRGGAWPLACDDCHRQFGDKAVRQVHYELLYALPDGTLCTNREMPVGAIWRAEHMEAHWGNPGDGRCYQVQLPPGGLGDQWIIEQPSQSGGHWTRTGEPPDFTCSPSILTPRYHGFLQNGVLTDDLDGHRYD